MSVDESDLSTLLSSATLVLVGAILGSFSKLVERIIIGRSLSPDAYGEVSIGLAILGFATIFALVGFTHGIPRYMARFDSERDVRGAWITGLLITMAIGLLFTAILFFNVDLLVYYLFEGTEAPRLVQLFVLCIPLIVGLRVGVGGIRGFENTIYRTYARDLVYPGVRIVLLVVFLSLGYGVLAAGLAYLGAALVAVVVAHLLLNRLISLVGAFTTHTKEMLLFSAPLAISTVLSLLLTRTDTLMVGYFRPSFEVGLYSAAFPLANGLLVVLSSFGFIYLPLASRLDANDKREEIDTIYTITTKWIFIVTFPAFLTFVLFPGDVLRIFFGAEYVEAALALSILSVGFFTSAAAGRNRETISALGYTTYILFANALAFFLNIGLNLVLIPQYGYLGAAVTSALSYITLNVTVYLILRQKFGITPFSTWSIRTFTLVPLIAFPPVVLLAEYVSLTIVTFPLFLVLAGLATVCIVCLTGCLQPEDRIALEFVEEKIGVRVPFVRQYVPESRNTAPE